MVEIDRQADAKGGARGQRRTVIIRLRFVVEKVVDGSIDADATPQIVLEHELPDGIALIDICTARLRFAMTTCGEGGIEGIEA